jgi:hypothetical protein
MQKIDRATAQKHLKKGWAVLDAEGHLLESPRLLPPVPPEGESAPEPELYATRHESGHLTHEALQAIIRNGGSVLHNGVVIDKVADLPDESELAQGDLKRLETVETSLDDQIAALTREKTKLGQAKERAQEAAKAAPAETEAPEAPKGAAKTQGHGAHAHHTTHPPGKAK